MWHEAGSTPRADRSKCMQGVHEAGLAHCDIKPSNIVLTEDGHPKLADFGAACAIDPSTGVLAAAQKPDSAAVREQDLAIERLVSNLSKDFEGPCTPSMPSMHSMRDSAQSLLRRLDFTLQSDCDRSGMLSCPESEHPATRANGVGSKHECPMSVALPFAHAPPSLMLNLPPSLQHQTAAAQLSLSPLSSLSQPQQQTGGNLAPFQGVCSRQGGSLYEDRAESTPTCIRRSSSLKGWHPIRSTSSSLRDVPMVCLF